MPRLPSAPAALRAVACLALATVLLAPVCRAADAPAADSGFARPPSPHVHALILTIGAYRNGIPPLTGVARDADNAREIARRMGVPPAHITVLRDAELTLDGLRRAFDQLDGRVRDGDEVFVYYSGHGGRQKVVEAGVERCAESLITVDGYGFTDAELETRLKALSTRAGKMVVFLDACHSGGVTTRATRVDPPFLPKYWQGKAGGGDACARPVNVLTRDIVLATATPGSGGANYAYIAAARDNEISLDQPGKGGLATQAWLACLAGQARDTDGSGGLSAEEIRVCAQQHIDAKLKNAEGFLPHHVAITGNRDMVLAYDTKAGAAALPAVLPSPSATASPTPAAPTAPVAVPPAVPTALPLKASPLATLHDLYANRDDRRLVQLATATPRVRIGRDEVRFTLSSREGGYVYLLMVGSNGEAFDLLFPNALDRDNRLRPGETLTLPRRSWQIGAGGPAGTDTLLALVTDSPRDFRGLGLKPVGPFSAIEPTRARDIQLVTAHATPPADCPRDLAAQPACSASYGAALLRIEEVVP
ncbi:MAG TPA: caspase family protein [Rhodocyclaceae bacterium]|nr:caspase family protein [Rhodocyclaceae bacterium]